MRRLRHYGFWEMLTEEQISGIRAVAMDTWDPYIASVRERVSEADGDKFHVAKHLGDAVDKVRRKGHKTLKAAGDERLAGTRYYWLRRRWNRRTERVFRTEEQRAENRTCLGAEGDGQGAV